MLDRAEALLPVVRGSVPPLKATNPALIAMLFLENSTRTRCSFQTAAYRLGHQAMLLGSSGTSLSKGESFLDTAKTIAAMGVDAIVVRTSQAGGPALLTEHLACPILNAGDGRNEHPTQALLDALALRGRLGDLAGRTIVIVGDITNSRVARSNVWCLSALGASIVLCGPPPLLPQAFEALAPERCLITDNLDDALARADAVMMLRVQRERGGARSIGKDYATAFGLTDARAANLGSTVPILHPGPANKGVEIGSGAYDDASRSLIQEQVTCGVAIRMAAIERAVGTKSDWD
jgi:aspartate carbamoyltransferase catalytic subunit